MSLCQNSPLLLRRHEQSSGAAARCDVHGVNDERSRCYWGWRQRPRNAAVSKPLSAIDFLSFLIPSLFLNSAAAVSIAMGNAPPSVAAVAHMVTQHVDNGGWAAAVNYLLDVRQKATAAELNEP